MRHRIANGQAGCHHARVQGVPMTEGHEDGARNPTVSDPATLVAAGEAAAGRGDLDLAERCFRTALLADPAHVDALNDLGVVLVARGDPHGAERCFLMALALGADPVAPYTNLATIHRRSGRTREAVALLKQGLIRAGEAPALIAELTLLRDTLAAAAEGRPPPEAALEPARNGVTITAAGPVFRASGLGYTWHIPAPLTGLFQWARGFHARNVRFESDALLQPGDVVIDVGSCTGEYTLYAAREVGPTGRVHAFEPDPQYRACLERNLEWHGAGNVQVHPVAVSDEAADALELYAVPESMGGGSLDRAYADTQPRIRRWTVPVVTLDGVFGDDLPDEVAMLEVTVNGVEPAVFRGASRLLARTRRVIFQSAEWAECLEVLQAHGFSMRKMIDMAPLRSKETYGRVYLMQRG